MPQSVFTAEQEARIKEFVRQEINELRKDVVAMAHEARIKQIAAQVIGRILGYDAPRPPAQAVEHSQ